MGISRLILIHIHYNIMMLTCQEVFVIFSLFCVVFCKVYVVFTKQIPQIWQIHMIKPPIREFSDGGIII